MREAQILEELKYSYILPIVDVGIEDGFPYIVAEYASNGSLRDRIKSRAPSLLPLHEILTILTQIGQALSYAHQRHIIHRDIKPENILFNAKNEALLADFGLATSLSTASVKYVDNAGTPRYMPPEQFQGHISKESDQYSLACIAYELVTGHQPFIEKDFYTLGFKHLTENPVPPTQINPHLPVAVEQVILKAMAKQRTDRYRDVSSFIAALVQAASFQPYSPTSSQTQISTLPSSNVKENSQDGTLVQTWRVDQTPTFVNRTPITPLPSVQEAGLLHPSHSNSARRTLPTDHDESITSQPRGQADKQRTAGVDGHASTNAPAVRLAGNLAGSSPSLVMKRGSSIGQQWLMVGVVCLVIAASILGGFLLILPSVLSSRLPNNGLGVSPRSTVVTPGKTATEKQPSAKHSTPSGKSTGQSTLGSGSQTKVNSTPQPGRTSQPTPTSQAILGPTPFPTPTLQPTSPPSPTLTAQRGTSETLTVSFLSDYGAQTVNSYSGTVTVTVSGAGGVSPKGISDAFYMYTDFSGNPLNPPQHASCWVMDINGLPSEDFVPKPPYNTSYWYSFTMLAPGGTLNFSICDHKRYDNHGVLTVTVTQD